MTKRTDEAIPTETDGLQDRRLLAGKTAIVSD